MRHSRFRKVDFKIAFPVLLGTGPMLFFVGWAFLSFNPYWKADEFGSFSKSFNLWNGLGMLAMNVAVIATALSIPIFIGWAALLKRRIRSVALLIAWFAGTVGVAVVFITLHPFTRYLVTLQWSPSDGFESYKIVSAQEYKSGRNTEVNGSVWRFVVSSQTKPIIRSFLRNTTKPTLGAVGIRVGKLLPIAQPVALGSGRQVFNEDTSYK